MPEVAPPEIELSAQVIHASGPRTRTYQGLMRGYRVSVKKFKLDVDEEEQRAMFDNEVSILR